MKDIFEFEISGWQFGFGFFGFQYFPG